MPDLERAIVWKPAVAIVAVIALFGCSSSSKTTKTTTPATVTPTIPLITTTTVAGPGIDPCTLLTAQDAKKLTGLAVTRTPVTNADGIRACRYAAGTSGGAEVTIKVDADPRTAHDDFPAWVQPIPGHAAGLTTNSVPNLGDEASSTRNLQVNNGIYVRRGATLVKIGAFPAVSDAALLAAARTALARLRASG
jgi:hypothetical protein